MPSSTSEPPDRRDRAGAELVRGAREASGGRYRAAGPTRRCWRRIAEIFGEVLGDTLGEIVVVGAALALFGGVAGLTWWAWQRSVVGTIGVYLAVAVFLTYGVAVIWRARQPAGDSSPQTRLASGAAVSVVAIALWLIYVAVYRW